MVDPSCLADTVTPPSFSPAGEEIAPFSTWSAAMVGVVAPAITRIAALANRMLRRLVMRASPYESSSSRISSLQNFELAVVVNAQVLQRVESRLAAQGAAPAAGAAAAGAGTVRT